MRALTAKQMLRIWEDGQNRSLLERALIFLSNGCPEEEREVLSRLPIGERDSRLLALRELTFGSNLSSLATCPSCGERLELKFSVDDVRVPAPSDAGQLTFEADDYRIGFRLPNSGDLDSLLPGPEGRMQLLRRCVTSATRNGATQTLDLLPRQHVDALVERIGDADPRADVKAALTCPSCQHCWQAVFDIVSFFWEELEAWVQRILRDVHVLASAYGWREDDVLALSPWRRQFYLRLVRQ
jgi:T4 bacteriophage base plate protein